MPYYLSMSLSPLSEGQHVQVQGVLNRYKDWMRYLGSNYLIYTSQSSHEVYDAVKPVLPADATVIIMKARPDEEHRGWMSQAFIDWVGKPRSDAIVGL